jgi:hypothetical protein
MESDLGEIKSHTFNNKIILAIDARWADYFNSQNLVFKATIQDGKYVLVGPKLSNPGPTHPDSNEADDSG